MGETMSAEGLVIAPAAEEDGWAHCFVVIQRMEPLDGGFPARTGRDLSFAWQRACGHLTRRVEYLSPTCALLDLGTCTAAEALGAVQSLLAHLAVCDMPARAGIAPSGCLAKLALLRAPASVAVRLVSPDEAPALLHTTPVALLPRLRVAGVAGEISPAVVERLQSYGLRTLGQVGRLGELALRRQFGARIGAVLAALATGHDPRPLSPTPPPASLRVRLRVPAGALESEQVPAVLAHFAGQVARHLRELGRHARTLQLVICWETGARQQAAHTFQQPTSDPVLLLDALRRLLVPRLAPHDAITSLHLTLLDFAPVTPEQATFWRTHAQRRAALEAVAGTLTRRHGKPLLLAPRLTEPDAVFPEERYALTHGLSDLALADTEAAPARADSHQPVPCSDGPWDVWHDVPRRLHWW